MKKKREKKILYIIMIILILTFSFLFIYTKKSSQIIIKIASIKVDKYLKSILSDNISYNVLNHDNLNNILILNKNKNDEILYVDYNLDKAYKTLDILTKTLNKKIAEYETSDIKNINDYKVLGLPLFINSKNAFLINLGPKIYISFKPVGTILTNVQSKITDYGLNNALVELYATLVVTENIITPFNEKEINLQYNVLIASKVINGRIPNIYGSSIESKGKIKSYK